MVSVMAMGFERSCAPVISHDVEVASSAKVMLRMLTLRMSVVSSRVMVTLRFSESMLTAVAPSTSIAVMRGTTTGSGMSFLMQPPAKSVSSRYVMNRFMPV